MNTTDMVLAVAPRDSANIESIFCI
jgi:hypothetical protein